MTRTHAWMMTAVVLIVACGDKPARREAGPVAEPTALPPPGARAALEDAGVVGDGGVVNDVVRAAQGAGYGDVEFAIKPTAPDAAAPAPPAP